MTRIKIRAFGQTTRSKALFSVLIFDKREETLASVTKRIREKLNLPQEQEGGGMLMFEDGGIIDDLNVIMHDDKIEVLSAA